MMYSFHRPDCSAIIDAFPTRCGYAYDMLTQDQEFGGFVPESEISSLILSGFLDKDCALVGSLTAACP